ncbi:MAG: hypothetical protein ACRDLF_11735 [Solirubrobacteraceae bacterium]
MRRAPALAAALAASVAGAGLAGAAASHALGASTSAAGGAREAAVPGAARASEPIVGRAAHVVSVKDEGHLHLVSNSGSNLVEEGPVTGTIPGKVRVSFNVGPTVYASFTIYVKAGGSISGKGHGTLHSTSAYSTFGGSLSVTHGTGRYAHAHGTGGLYGAINRKSSTYPMTVQTTGKLYY